jgi:hypothetical protein
MSGGNTSASPLGRGILTLSWASAARPGRTCAAITCAGDPHCLAAAAAALADAAAAAAAALALLLLPLQLMLLLLLPPLLLPVLPLAPPGFGRAPTGVRASPALP